MPCIAKRILVLGLLGVLLGTSPRAGFAEEATSGFDVGRAGLIAVDVFPIRFGGVLRTIVGGVYLVPATIFSVIAMPFERNPDVFRENVQLYVVDPFDYTFNRPLGQDL